MWFAACIAAIWPRRSIRTELVHRDVPVLATEGVKVDEDLEASQHHLAVGGLGGTSGVEKECLLYQFFLRVASDLKWARECSASGCLHVFTHTYMSLRTCAHACTETCTHAGRVHILYTQMSGFSIFSDVLDSMSRGHGGS